MKLFALFTFIFLFLCIEQSFCAPCSQSDINWIYMNGKCFQFFKHSYVNWKTAQVYCQQNFYNGTLAEPVTYNELKALVDFVQPTGTYSYFWIGSSDVRQEGNFVWESDNSFSNISFWGSGQPDNSWTENCLMIAYEPAIPAFVNDGKCEYVNLFICQSDPCDTYFPESLYGNGQCYKYFNLQLTRDKAQAYCLEMNSHLAEPETEDSQRLLQTYLYKRNAWIGLTKVNCTQTLRWLISAIAVTTNMTLQVDTSCQTNSILWVNYISTSYWKAIDGQAPNGFVCQKPIVITDTRLYVAVVPKLSKTSSIQGLLQVTSNYTDVIYIRLKVSYNIGFETRTILPLGPRTAANFYLHQNNSLDTTDVYARFIEINSSLPVTVVLYTMGHSMTLSSSTLIYPVSMYQGDLTTSYFPVSASLFKNASHLDQEIMLTATAMSGETNVTVFLNAEDSSYVFLKNMTVNFGTVDNISVSLDSLYQTMNLHLKSNLDGAYLHSTQPVKVYLGTVAGTSGQTTFDSTLDELLPLAYTSNEYFSFPANVSGSEISLKVRTVYNWTSITLTSSSVIETILLEDAGTTYEKMLDTTQFYYINGNASFYVYQLYSRLTGDQENSCVTSLLPPSVWRYEYEFARISDAFTVMIYVIGDVNMTSIIETSDDSVHWSCQDITGVLYSGCYATLPANVTYLHLQSNGRLEKFGAYVLAYSTVSSFCHPLGVEELAPPSDTDHFHQAAYIQSIKDRNRLKSRSSCFDTTTTYSTDWTPDDTTEATSHLTTASLQSSETPTARDITTSDAHSALAVKERVDAIKAFLAVDLRNVSSFRRTLTSASDPRVSSQIFGGTGLIFVSLVFVLLTAADLIRVIECFQRWRQA